MNVDVLSIDFGEALDINRRMMNLCITNSGVLNKLEFADDVYSHYTIQKTHAEESRPVKKNS